MRHREKLDIINKICEVISNIRNIHPTSLMFRANLSPETFKDYRKELLEKKFIKEIRLPKGSLVNGRKTRKDLVSFKLTEKGVEYMKFYEKLTTFKEKYGLDEK